MEDEWMDGAWQVWFAALAMGVMSWAVPVDLYAQSEPGSESVDEQGIYYGDGLRHLAEGRYQAAVEALFRAYGLEPSAHVMELIVDAYDQMGDCRAARRQAQFLEQRHDIEGVELDDCQSTGRLVVDCQEFDQPVTINDGIEARCGEETEVPAGRTHRVVWNDSGVVERVVVGADQRQRVEYPAGRAQAGAEVLRVPGLSAEVSRIPGLSEEVPRLPFELDDEPEVPRLTLPTDFDQGHYRIIETPAGIYRIWTPETTTSDSADDAEVDIIGPEDADPQDRCAEDPESSL